MHLEQILGEDSLVHIDRPFVLPSLHLLELFLLVLYSTDYLRILAWSLLS